MYTYAQTYRGKKVITLKQNALLISFEPKLAYEKNLDF